MGSIANCWADDHAPSIGDIINHSLDVNWRKVSNSHERLNYGVIGSMPMYAQKRRDRLHQLQEMALVSRRMLEAVYAIDFNRYPPAGMPDKEVIQEIMDVEFPPRPGDADRPQNPK
jgi:hypothetical protein